MTDQASKSVNIPRRFVPVRNGTAFSGMKQLGDSSTWDDELEPYVRWSDYERLTAALAACQTYDYRTLADEIERLREALAEAHELMWNLAESGLMMHGVEGLDPDYKPLCDWTEKYPRGYFSAETRPPELNLGPSTEWRRYRYWEREAGPGLVTCNSRVVGGVLCRWWGDGAVPEGVALIDAALQGETPVNDLPFPGEHAGEGKL